MFWSPLLHPCVSASKFTPAATQTASEHTPVHSTVTLMSASASLSPEPAVLSTEQINRVLTGAGIAALYQKFSG